MPLLWPLSWLWAAATWVRRRVWRNAAPNPIPVICFGNIHDGGTGKTPLVLACVKRFAARKPVVVSRGYGGSASRTLATVNANEPQAASVYGDEPVLMASQGATVVVGRDRAGAVAMAAKKHGAGWAVLDDGFQRLSVRKTFAVVVLPADRSPWSSWCWPAGALREPLSAMQFADAIVITSWPGEEKGVQQWEAHLEKICPRVSKYRAVGRVDGFRDPTSGIAVMITDAVAGLCAIGAPERFLRHLRARSHVVHEQAFADHHPFTEAEILAFVQACREAGATAIVTTAKDWPRLAPMTQHIGLPIRLMEIGYDVPETLWHDMEKCVMAATP